MDKPARKDTVAVSVGSVVVGGGHPVVVQSMTNTDTADAVATAAQVAELHNAGSELVRITVNNAAAAAAVPEIHQRLRDQGIGVPLIGDFHYNGHRLLREHPDAAQCLDKYRINPGNVGKGTNHDKNFATMIEVAKEHDTPVRIGVNAGSLDQDLLSDLMEENSQATAPKGSAKVLLDAMVESAIRSAEAAEQLGLGRDKIILSCKISDVSELVEVYQMLSDRSDHALHLGLTEAGMGNKGVISSSTALAILLHAGIGDTIRVSLTPKPGGLRTEEVRVSQQILQSLGIRPFLPSVTACPGCGRTTSTYFQELSQKVESFLERRMPEWQSTNPKAATLKVAVMGCVVNGPGESKAAHLGISLPGTGEAPRSPVYIDGQQHTTLEGPSLADDFLQLIEHYVAHM
ncbi:MAG: flavodoxin-dependent (E)-4-hydroxy-3-methylbut-2-enyl-diphosphate synthase [Planctomycetota bacterium]|nr:flavodoxin-dependent (E)-4-hydroxy-3-methylbut-2-enyl-diphosphate synthase [Planctomycetota bacterium]